MNKLLTVAAAICLTSAQASAATIYADRSAFNALGGAGAFFTDFENQGESGPVPFAFGPVDFGSLHNRGAAYYWAADGQTTVGDVGNVNGSAFVQVRLSNYHDGMIEFVTGPLTLSSANGFQMIGFDIRPYFDVWGSSNGGESVLYWTDTGESGKFTLSASNTIGFLGLALDTQAHAINFRIPATKNGHTWFGIDNLQTWQSSVSAVPEPASLAMLLAGLGAVGLVAARRRKQGVQTPKQDGGRFAAGS